MTGKANLERARRLLDAADKVVTADAPADLPVLLALLDLALKRDALRASLHWNPIPFGLDAAVEGALRNVLKVLKSRM